MCLLCCMQSAVSLSWQNRFFQAKSTNTRPIKHEGIFDIPYMFQQLKKNNIHYGLFSRFPFQLLFLDCLTLIYAIARNFQVSIWEEKFLALLTYWELHELEKNSIQETQIMYDIYLSAANLQPVVLVKQFNVCVGCLLLNKTD